MKFVRITANICFEEVDGRQEEFEREFESFSGTDSNPVDDFIQKLKAREGKNLPDAITLTLLVELHKKIDDLTKIVKNETKELARLANEQALDFAWFDTIKVTGLKSGSIYYARVYLPLFRPRPVPFFCEAIDEDSAKIIKIWPDDKADFDGYLASKDREEIARERGL